MRLRRYERYKNLKMTLCLKFTTVLLIAKMGVFRTTFVTEIVEELLRSCRGAGEELERRSWGGAGV